MAQKQQNNCGENNHTAMDNAALLPHLESLEKMMKLPVVEAAWHQGQDVYEKVKGNFLNNIFRIILKCKNLEWNI